MTYIYRELFTLIYMADILGKLVGIPVGDTGIKIQYKNTMRVHQC